MTAKALTAAELDRLQGEIRLMRASGARSLPLRLRVAERMIAQLRGALPQANSGRSA